MACQAASFARRCGRRAGRAWWRRNCRAASGGRGIVGMPNRDLDVVPARRWARGCAGEAGVARPGAEVVCCALGRGWSSVVVRGW